jgi:signal transduction histidine kinase
VAGNLLLRESLSAPIEDLALIFSAAQLPTPPGSTTITWAAAIIALVLCGGFLVIYQTGMRQIQLAEQQQDFVSAVSHELKTPLTSIRMYGEILKAGWADEAKKRTYYDFIFSESERLTRLINNVLQLARLTRNEHPVDLADMKVNVLLDQVTSKVSSAIDSAGFALELQFEPSALDASVRVDADAFIQVMINLVDNALKFSASASHRTIQLRCRLKNSSIEFSVRDFGPGVAKDQMKRIFRLFYRAENELTRETVGTGIGLALVRQLVDAMHGEVDLVNREPGAEFRVVLPRL